MASRGETVKYVIDADTSGFARGMLEAAAESDLAGKTITKNLNKTSKNTENNFKDIRGSAQKTASQIRNFGLALQGFNTTSLIIGVTALSGAIIELSGAIAAAGSTTAILAPALIQAGAATATFKTGISGLGAAFKAIGKNDGAAFAQSMQNLGPAAKQVALAAGSINKAFNGIKLNVQQALLAGIGDEMLRLAAGILPTLNAGMQEVAQSFNSAFKQAAALANTPIFKGLLATIFADTARNVQILSGALAPLLSIFTNLYLVTRPYVSLLAQEFVNLTKNAAAFLGSVKGQAALNLAIQEGIIAITEIGHLVGAVFGLLTAIFATSVNSGNNLIVTLTGIIKQTEGWVNSAKGQQDLISLFDFTSLALKNVAHSISIAAQLFFGIINLLDSLSPAVQAVVLQFLSFALAIGPISSYFLKLFGAIKLVGTVIVNLVQQLFVVFGALGAVASIALVLGGGLIILGAIIKGPLGAALIVVGSIIVAYIGLNYLLSLAAAAATRAMLAKAEAAIVSAQTDIVAAETSTVLAATLGALAVAGEEAGGGLAVAASGAELLQVALIPLLVLAAGVLLLLGMLGVFGGKTKAAQSATSGLGTSLGALQKSLKGVGGAGTKASTGGLSALNDSLSNVGDAADGATGSLASFDKMNVLTDNSAAGAGISGLPALPDVGGASLGAPTLDTGDFDKALADMQKNFGNLSKQIQKPITNPFDSLGKWIDSHPWLALLGFIGVLVAIGAAFLIFGIEVAFATLPLTLIVLAVIAIIAIIIILVKNWSTVWAAIQIIVEAFGTFILDLFKGIGSFIGGILDDIGGFFVTIFDGVKAALTIYINIYIAIFQFLWDGIQAIFSVAVAFFQAIWDGIKAGVTILWTALVAGFQLAWQGIQVAFGAVVGFFQGIWSGITGVFSAVGSFFGSVFSAAWQAIQNAFSAVGGFFSGVWTTIKNIFTTIGSTIGGAVEDAFKAVINGVLGTAQTVLNAPITTINALIKKINSIPGVPNLPTLGTFTLPRLAKGGIINSPTIAEIGEHGAEAVMPLENNTGWIDMLADKLNSANGNGSQQPINLTVQIGEDKVANKIIDLINERTQMSGRNSILV